MVIWIYMQLQKVVYTIEKNKMARSIFSINVYFLLMKEIWFELKVVKRAVFLFENNYDVYSINE